MPLDLPTLFVVSICVTALLGLFLVMLWLQDRSVRALGWWALAYLIGGFSVALWLLQPAVIGPWSQDLASAMLFLCCGMIWNGARMFHGRAMLGLAMAGGAIIWLAVTRNPDVAGSEQVRIVLSSIIIAIYVSLTAIELKRERRAERSTHRHAVLLAALHGVVFLSPIMVQYAFPRAAQGFGEGVFALFALLTLLYVVGTAFIVVVMAKEQSLTLHRTAALTDALTGLFNRRGFFEHAQKLLDSRLRKDKPVSVLMFDLDHFKSINDRFGHDTGDDALRLFASTITTTMRSEDILGRLGGEEFVAILPAGLDDAIGIAQRVRLAFELAGRNIAGRQINATVSVGATLSPGRDCTIPQLLSRADRALYRAKSGGRNCVVADSDIGEPQLPHVEGPPLHCNESASRHAVESGIAPASA